MEWSFTIQVQVLNIQYHNTSSFNKKCTNMHGNRSRSYELRLHFARRQQCTNPRTYVSQKALQHGKPGSRSHKQVHKARSAVPLVHGKAIPDGPLLQSVVRVILVKDNANLTPRQDILPNDPHMLGGMPRSITLRPNLNACCRGKTT